MISKTIVIVAQEWNPTILTADWLNRLDTPIDDFETEVVLPPLSIAKSPQIKLICQPQKLQLLLNDPEADGTVLCQVAEAILQKLHETSYTAVGINFQEAETFRSEEALGEFFAKRITIHAIPGFCGENDEALGAAVHLVKDLDESIHLTLKLLQGQAQGEPAAILDFNFHHDVEGVGAAIEALGAYDAHQAMAEAIVGGMCNGEG